jgi:hypothetical protein
VAVQGAIVSAAILAAAACGSSGTSPGSAGSTAHQATVAASSSPSPAPTLSFCQDVNSLRATLATLTPIKGAALPTSATMKNAVRDIQSALSGLSSRAERRTQIDNVRAATDNMETAADNLAASPGARGVPAQVRTAVAGVTDSIRRLITAVGSRCPSPSPAPSS